MRSPRFFWILSVLLLTLVLGLGVFASLNWPKRVPDLPRPEREALAASLTLPHSPELPSTFPAVARLVMPSVVGITVLRYASGENPAGEVKKRFPHLPKEFERYHHRGPRPHFRPEDTTGSGVIIEVEGDTAYILTNDHVVQRHHRITVSLSDNREFEGKFEASDAKTDLALLRIDGRDLEAAKLGESEELQVGEWVLAIGNPFGLNHTVTNGIISAKGRSDVHMISSNFSYENFIQTDAAINPGNSGGPLVNLRAEVVGINTAIASLTGGYQGVGFAIPIDQARKIYRRLRKEGKVSRGWLGVDIAKIEAEDAKVLGLSAREGVLIRGIRMDTPAARAGLQQGDVILQFNDAKVRTVEELRYAVADTPAGCEVNVVVLRGGQSMTLQVRVGEQPADNWAVLPPLIREENELGLEVRELTPELAQESGYEGKKGVLITEVDETGRAARAGIIPGMLIQGLHQGADRQFEIRSLEDYKKALKNLNVNEPVGITLRSKDESVQLVTVR